MTHPHFPGNRTAPRSARSPPPRAGTWRPFCARRNSTAACCGREDRRRVDWRSTCTRRQRRSWVWRVQHVGTRSGIFLHMFASLTCWKYELEVVRLVVWQKNEGGPHNLLLVLLLYIYTFGWETNEHPSCPVGFVLFSTASCSHWMPLKDLGEQLPEAFCMMETTWMLLVLGCLCSA
jgi:hypothetical protein